MNPGTDEQVLARARDCPASQFAHASKVLDSAAKENIIPTCKIQGGNLNILVSRPNAPSLPIGVPSVMSHPVEVVGRDAWPQLGRPQIVHKRQVLINIRQFCCG